MEGWVNAVIFAIFLAPLIFLLVRFVLSLRCLHCKKFKFYMLYSGEIAINIFAPQKFICFSCRHLHRVRDDKSSY